MNRLMRCCLVGVATTALASCEAPAPRDIVFASRLAPGSDSLELFAMPREGGPRRQLTDNGSSNFPTLSPDGRTIAYSHRPPGGRLELHMMDASGTNSRMAARFDSLDVYSPEWSFDGQRVAFVAADNGPDVAGWLYTINRDGTGLRRVPNSAGLAQCVGWATDNETLLVSEFGPAASLPSRVVGIDVASGRREPVAESDTLGLVCPVVAPDGSGALISVALYDEARSRIVGMNIFSFSLEDGSVRPFVPIQFAKNPRWSPDGRQIVFHGEDHMGWAAPTDSLDLYTLNRDGQNLVRLTRNVIADIHPAW